MCVSVYTYGYIRKRVIIITLSSMPLIILPPKRRTQNPGVLALLVLFCRGGLLSWGAGLWVGGGARGFAEY